MATRINLLSISCLRNESGYNGHAMPFDRVKLCITVFAQGRSMPISRGSPPIP